MACTNCNKAHQPAPAVEVLPEESSPLTFTAAATHVTGTDGIKRRIDGPLVELRNRGHGGWKVKIPVKGHVQVVDGNTPQEVFKSASELLAANGVRVRAIDLWFNLNKQWIERAVQKRQMVKIANLMEAAAQGGEAPQVPAKARQNVPPAVWGNKGWGMLQQYLALDNYGYPVFLALATELGTWVDPDKNPSTGCADCYRHYSIALAKLQKTPRYSQREAREWLVESMNAVNRYRLERGEANVRIFTYEQAAKANHWQE